MNVKTEGCWVSGELGPCALSLEPHTSLQARLLKEDCTSVNTRNILQRPTYFSLLVRWKKTYVELIHFAVR